MTFETYKVVESCTYKIWKQRADRMKTVTSNARNWTREDINDINLASSANAEKKTNPILRISEFMTNTYFRSIWHIFTYIWVHLYTSISHNSIHIQFHRFGNYYWFDYRKTKKLGNFPSHLEFFFFYKTLAII